MCLVLRCFNFFRMFPSTIKSLRSPSAKPFNGNHKNLCWVTETCVTIKYMTRDEWGWICSPLIITLVQLLCYIRPDLKSSYALGIKKSLKIFQLTSDLFSAFVHAWNMLHMCIYVLDIIIMHISPQWFTKQIFHDWA